MRILLTDGNERATLAAARSLHRGGHSVHVAADRPRCLAGVSRGIVGRTVHGDPLESPAEYARNLADVASACGADIVVPVSDAAAEAVLENRTLFSPDVTIPLPPITTFRQASDKVGILGHALAAGFAVPDSAVVHMPREIATLPLGSLLPGVVKPYRSVIEVAGVRRKFGVSFVNDAASQAVALRRLPAEAYPVLVQRSVTGAGEGMFLLRWDGQILASFAHRRLREKPPQGGVSVYRESIAPPPDLLASASRLLDVLDWQGVAMVETKRDATTGACVFMEVNGRFWGSLQLAIDAGVDFPALLVACASGHAPQVAGPHPYRVGVRSRWFWGDVDHLYAAWKRPSSSGDNGSPMRARLRAVKRFVTVRPRRDREEILRWRDPLPFVLETAQRFGLMR